MANNRIEGSLRIVSAGSSFPNGLGDLIVGRTFRVAGSMKETRTATASSTPTGAQMIAGIVTVDTSGGHVTLTTGTAAAMVAALPGVAVGDTVSVLVQNFGHATNLVSVAAGTGVTILGTLGSSVPQNTTPVIASRSTRLLQLRFTNVTSGAEAVSLY